MWYGVQSKKMDPKEEISLRNCKLKGVTNRKGSHLYSRLRAEPNGDLVFCFEQMFHSQHMTLWTRCSFLDRPCPWLLPPDFLDFSCTFLRPPSQFSPSLDPQAFSFCTFSLIPGTSLSVLPFLNCRNIPT